MYLSVVIPAYNEAVNLQKNINRYDDYLRRQGFEYEIIIVNDGSADDTGKIARELARDNGKITVVEFKTNRGKGAAVRSGLLAARGDYRLFIDADNATAIDHLEKVWPLFRAGYDIVIGSRNPRDAAATIIRVGQPRWKVILGKIGNFLIRLLAVSGIRDTQCGFKVFTAQAAAAIIPKTVVTRWAIDVEILVLARRLGYRIGIIPVSWVNSATSRVGPNDYLDTLIEVIKIKLRSMSENTRHDK